MRIVTKMVRINFFRTLKIIDLQLFREYLFKKNRGIGKTTSDVVF